MSTTYTSSSSSAVTVTEVTTPTTTQLTCVVEQHASYANEVFAITGYLTTSAGLPLEGQRITLQKYVTSAWVDQDSTLTSSSGSYFFKVAGAGAAGAYQYKTTYAGGTL